MKTIDYLHLDEKTTNEVVNGLQALLANLQVYYTNLRGFHWNVQGSGFFQLHAKYEELYNDTAEKVDEVAERILTLGQSPKHNFSEYLKIATIKETSVITEGKEIAKQILESIKEILSQERSILAIAGEGKDEGTVAMMSEFIAQQEKTVWMLNAQLS